MFNFFKKTQYEIRKSLFTISLILLSIISTPCIALALPGGYASAENQGWKYENGNLVNTVRYYHKSGDPMRPGGTSVTYRTMLIYLSSPYSSNDIKTFFSSLPNGSGDYWGSLSHQYNGYTVTYSPGSGAIQYTKGSSWSHRLTGGDIYIKVTIPHGTTTDPSKWKNVRYGYMYESHSQMYYTTSISTGDASAMVQHVKTCTGGNWETNANQHRKRCSTCGYVASNWANHTWTTTKAATCTAEGQKKCTTCGYTTSIPKIAHSYQTTWTTNANQHYHKCKNCNATKDAANHTFVKKYDNNQHWDQCSVCGYQKNKAFHSWTYSNLTATMHDKKCSCGKTVTKEAHNFVNNKCACGRYNTVTVSFNLNKPNPTGGLLQDTSPSSINAITYTYGDKYLDGKYGLATPTLNDYKFLGWYTAVSGGSQITSSTAVTNSNAHTLYAHWETIPISINSISLSNVSFIEYTGLTEAKYNAEYYPDDIYPYANASSTAKYNGSPEDRYKYTWEYKGSDGVWHSLSLNSISADKNGFSINNGTRDLNGISIRLTVRNNSGDTISSNEAKITTYYLPKTGDIIVDSNRPTN